MNRLPGPKAKGELQLLGKFFLDFGPSGGLRDRFRGVFGTLFEENLEHRCEDREQLWQERLADPKKSKSNDEKSLDF